MIRKSIGKSFTLGCLSVGVHKISVSMYEILLVKYLVFAEHFSRREQRAHPHI